MNTPSKSTLYDLYITQRLSLVDTGKKIGVSNGTIAKWLDFYGIQTRSHGTNGAEYPDKPTKEELEHLYLSERLTQRQIGERYGVSHKTVGVWVRGYEIPQRAQSRGLDNRGIEPPTSDELYRMVHLEHLSYREIAELYGVDQSAIPHWLVKHDIPKPDVWATRTNGQWVAGFTPDAETLHDLYVRQHLSTLQIAHQYDVTPSLVRNWLIRRNIERRAAGWDSKRLQCIDGHEVRSVYEQRVDNWLSLHRIPHEYEPATPFDKTGKADFLANGWYIEIWGVWGNARYTFRKNEKRRLYAEHEIPLIELGSYMFTKKKKDAWAHKLARHLIDHGDALPDQTPLPLHQTPVSYSSGSCDHTS